MVGEASRSPSCSPRAGCVGRVYGELDSKSLLPLDAFWPPWEKAEGPKNISSSSRSASAYERSPALQFPPKLPCVSNSPSSDPQVGRTASEERELGHLFNIQINDQCSVWLHRSLEVRKSQVDFMVGFTASLNVLQKSLSCVGQAPFLKVEPPEHLFSHPLASQCQTTVLPPYLTKKITVAF